MRMKTCLMLMRQGFIVIFFIGIFYSMICSFSRYLSESFSNEFLKSLNGPMKYDDPELIKYLTFNVLEPPSTKPLNLEQNYRQEEVKHMSEYFYLDFTKKYLSSKTNAFFVEAGALDGQSMSNTLWLEVQRNWTGLLLEPNPSSYNLLKTKNRRVWTANACISKYKYPALEILQSVDVATRINKFRDVRIRSMSSLLHKQNKDVFPTMTALQQLHFSCHCYPLESFLIALNVSRIDLLSIDLEGIEEEFITNFDFERFNIQVLYLEWWYGERTSWLKELLEGKGLNFVVNIAGNIIFVKNNTQLSRVLEEDFPDRKMTSFILEHKNELN